MYLCKKCGNGFSSFLVPGVCPICGLRAAVRCDHCGKTDKAQVFIDYGNRCPNCGARVQVSPAPPVPMLAPQSAIQNGSNRAAGVGAFIILGLVVCMIHFSSTQEQTPPLQRRHVAPSTVSYRSKHVSPPAQPTNTLYKNPKYDGKQRTISAARLNRAREEKEQLDRRVLTFHRQRALEGSPVFQYELGMRYINGHGVKQDFLLGTNWLRLAAHGGNTQARKKLGELLQRERNSPVNPVVQTRESLK